MTAMGNSADPEGVNPEDDHEEDGQEREPGNRTKAEPGGAGYQFAVGHLVRHRLYRYRGAVFDCDPHCQASEEWYESNATQPVRSQPWYHVLVHGSDHTTYVAEENLLEDLGREQVVHPLARRFFRYFSGGRYQVREMA